MENTATLVTFILYLVMMMGIGVLAYKQTNDLSDYILGGRKLGRWVTALSAGASDMSGWLLMGLPGAIYASGFSEAWIGLGLMLGAYWNWKVTAPRLRLYTEHAGNSLTLPDYFSNRFHDDTKALRIVSASIILIFFTVYVASGLTAGAKLFEASFGLDYYTALFIGGAVIISYTFLGGFLAVSWTDMVQGLLMAAALVVAPIVIIMGLGSAEVVRENVNAADVRLAQTCVSDESKKELYSSLEQYQNSDSDGRKKLEEKHSSVCNKLEKEESFRSSLFGGKSGLEYFFSIGFLSLMAWGLGYFGQPHLLARFMAAKSTKEVHGARRIAMSWMGISMLGALTVGFLGIAYLSNSEQGVEQFFNDETIFINLTKVIFNPWVAGFLLAAILAAVMSTIDSQLLVSSSAVTEDFYRGIIKPHADEKELVLVGRLAVLVVAAVAMFIAMDKDSKVLGLVANAWAGFGAAFGPVVLISLLWRGMTRWGALAGMISGAVTVILWIQFKKDLGDGWAQLYEMIPGVVIALLAIYLVSRFGPQNNTRVGDDFDHVQLTYKGRM